MRILVITSSYSPEIGGVQSVVLNLVRRAREAGHKVAVVATRAEGLGSRDTFEGVTIYRLPLVAPEASRHIIAFMTTFWKSLAGLRGIIADFKPDVLNAHFVSTGSSLFGMIASRLSGVPLVASVHGEDVVGMPMQSTAARLISKTALRRCVEATACSTYMAETAAGFAGIPLSKISVIRNGVDLSEFDEAEVASRRPLSIFSMGRFVPKKGFDVLISAFSLVRAEYPAARLVLGGDGCERARLEKLAGSLNLDDAVEFLGYISRDEVIHRLRECDVFVLPSRREPLGIAVLEAMAAGTPVVAAQTGGVPEIVKDGKNGLLVQPDDPNELAQAIIRLLCDAGLREEFSREGRRLVEECYSWEYTGRQFLLVFESALSKSADRCRGRVLLPEE